MSVRPFSRFKYFLVLCLIFIGTAGTLTQTSANGSDERTVENIIKALVEDETSQTADPALLSRLLEFEFSEKIAGAILDAFKNKTYEIRLAAADTAGKLGKKAKTMIPELLKRVESGPPADTMATRALLYLRPIVDKVAAYKALRAAYDAEIRQRRLFFAMGLIAFSDSSDTSQKAVLDDVMASLKTLIDAKTNEDTIVQLTALLELAPFCGPNTASLVPDLLEHFDDYYLESKTVEGEWTLLQGYILQLALSTDPGPDSKKAPLVGFLTKRLTGADKKSMDKMGALFSEAVNKILAYPLTARAELRANLNAFVERIEDSKESEELRTRLSNLFLQFGAAGQEFLPRLKAVKALKGSKLEENLEATIDGLEKVKR